MSKRKYKRGKQIRSLDEFFQHRMFIVNGKTFCAGWCRGWQLGLAQNYIRRGVAFVAVPLTNEEYYAGKTDEQIKDMLEERLCEFCSLPEEAKGVHCYGGQPVMCEGARCGDAIAAWKEEYVE